MMCLPLTETNRGERNREGWSTGIGTGPPCGGPHGPPNKACHVLDTKKPLFRRRVRRYPGDQSRPLDLQRQGKDRPKSGRVSISRRRIRRRFEHRRAHTVSRAGEFRAVQNCDALVV